MRKIVIVLALLLFSVLTMANDIPETVTGQMSFDFPACPDTPNCVSSLADDPGKQVDPFPLKGGPARSIEIITGIINSMPRATVVSESETRIESEFRSLLGFVDDVLFVISSDGEVVHVRSASRKGTWDLGVNRRRVERIRTMYLKNRE